MNVDYTTLEEDVESGAFRKLLESELIEGFREIHRSGDRLPPPSHYASQIAEIVSQSAPSALPSLLAYEIYQEILTACERATAVVLAEP